MEFGFVLPAGACVPCLAEKGEGFNVLWSEASRAQIADLVIAVVNEASCVVAGVNGRTEKGAETELELLLLPLGHDRRTRVRALGSCPAGCGLFSWAKTPSWSSNFARYVTSAPPKPASPSRNFKAARASAYGMTFWSIAASAKSGRVTAQTNPTLTIGS
ncbi:MAG: PAS domain-containing protein [Pseudolabrys sp.]